jgi:hypothetical protein
MIIVTGMTVFIEAIGIIVTVIEAVAGGDIVDGKIVVVGLASESH